MINLTTSAGFVPTLDLINYQNKKEDSLWYLKMKIFSTKPKPPLTPILNENMERPVLTISKIDQFGLMTVDFSEELILPKDVKNTVNKTALFIYLTPLNDAFTP